MHIILAILVILCSIWQFNDSFNKKPETVMDKNYIKIMLYETSNFKRDK